MKKRHNMYLSDLILQIPGLAPAYTKHPIFPDLFSAMIVAALISIGLNFAFALLRKKTTDIDRLSKVMKETNEWRKEYTDAIRKQDKVRISELKKKQAYVNKMSLEMQQQQMRPMMLYMIPSFMLWILVFPSIFGQTVALSPLHIPYLMCTDENVEIRYCHLMKMVSPKVSAISLVKFFYGDGFLLLRSERAALSPK